MNRMQARFTRDEIRISDTAHGGSTPRHSAHDEIRISDTARVSQPPALIWPSPGVAVAGGPVLLDLHPATAAVTTSLELTVAPSATVIEGSGKTEKPERTATGDDYSLVWFPIGTGFSVYAVLATVTDPATGAVWAVAAVLVAIIAMRNEDFAKMVARFADFLKP
jgi:hypothetical protein